MNILYKSLVSRITFICFTQVWHRRDDGWDSSEQGDMPSWRMGIYFPLSWVGYLAFCRHCTLNITLKTMRIFEQSACGRERWGPHHYPAAQTPDNISVLLVQIRSETTIKMKASQQEEV